MTIFADDRDYRWFIALMGDVLQDHEINCLNYCLMPNHYHLTLQPTLPNLSRALGRLNGGYALWWNRRHRRSGHVFQGRFKSQIVQREGYLLALCRYVARNPVRANLVARAEDWQWSSYAATIGVRTPPAFLDPAPTLRLFGEGTDTELQGHFRKYVATDCDESLEDRMRSTEPVVGERSFRVAIQGRTEMGRAVDLALVESAAASDPGLAQG
jgi:putative transposase